jgi:hypothetical protein
LLKLVIAAAAWLSPRCFSPSTIGAVSPANVVPGETPKLSDMAVGPLLVSVVASTEYW